MQHYCFDKSIIIYRQHNHINHLYNQNNLYVDDHNNIMYVLSLHFRYILTKSVSNRLEDIHKITQHFSKLVLVENNTMFLKEITFQ